MSYLQELEIHHNPLRLGEKTNESVIFRLNSQQDLCETLKQALIKRMDLLYLLLKNVSNKDRLFCFFYTFEKKVEVNPSERTWMIFQCLA